MKGKPIKLPKNTPPGVRVCRHALLLWQCAGCAREDEKMRDAAAEDLP